MRTPKRTSLRWSSLLVAAVALATACSDPTGSDDADEDTTESGDTGDGDGDGDGDPRCDGDPDAFVQVSAGDTHTCAVKGDCSVVCWGSNTVDESTPPDDAFIQVEVGGGGGGSNFSCGIRTDGTLACWGSFGASGNDTFTHLAAGSEEFCAIAEQDGTLNCRELEYVGPPPDGAFERVSVGDEHACALRADGTVECWTELDPEPAMPPNELFQQVSAGDFYSCGLTLEYGVLCWGELGAGLVLGQFSFIDCGRGFGCGIRPTGALDCWTGSEDEGLPELPDGEFTTLSVGKFHGCGVRTDGSVACWGENGEGQASPP